MSMRVQGLLNRVGRLQELEKLAIAKEKAAEEVAVAMIQANKAADEYLHALAEDVPAAYKPKAHDAEGFLIKFNRLAGYLSEMVFYFAGLRRAPSK